VHDDKLLGSRNDRSFNFTSTTRIHQNVADLQGGAQKDGLKTDQKKAKISLRLSEGGEIKARVKRIGPAGVIKSEPESSQRFRIRSLGRSESVKRRQVRGCRREESATAEKVGRSFAAPQA